MDATRAIDAAILTASDIAIMHHRGEQEVFGLHEDHLPYVSLNLDIYSVCDQWG
jgi:hypothetical protein